MKVREGVVPRVLCLIHETHYIEQQEVVLELVIDPYIHIDNSTTMYLFIERNVPDAEDPRLINTSQHSSL